MKLIIDWAENTILAIFNFSRQKMQNIFATWLDIVITEVLRHFRAIYFYSLRRYYFCSFLSCPAPSHQTDFLSLTGQTTRERRALWSGQDQGARRMLLVI